MEHIFTTDRADVMNKKAVFSTFRGEVEDALILWGTAHDSTSTSKSHQHTVYNLLIQKWRSGHISDDELIKELQENKAIEEREETTLLKGLTLIGLGE